MLIENPPIGGFSMILIDPWKASNDSVILF